MHSRAHHTSDETRRPHCTAPLRTGTLPRECRGAAQRGARAETPRWRWPQRRWSKLHKKARQIVYGPARAAPVGTSSLTHTFCGSGCDSPRPSIPAGGTLLCVHTVA